MPPFERGLYELLITEALAAQLATLADALEASKEDLRAAEAPDRIALHLSRIVHRALETLPENQRVPAAVTLTRVLLEQIALAAPGAGAKGEAIREPAEVLRHIAARLPDGRAETIPLPLIPLLDTTLLTNAPGEPRVGSQIATEIHSADRIDVVMAFIRVSGIRPLLDALRRYCEAGHELRVLTTTYTGSTEAAALATTAGATSEQRPVCRSCPPALMRPSSAVPVGESSTSTTPSGSRHTAACCPRPSHQPSGRCRNGTAACSGC